MEVVFNQGSRIEFLTDFDDRHGFKKKIPIFCQFDPYLAWNGNVIIILEVEYATALRPLVENVGGRGENLKIEKWSSYDAKKKVVFGFLPKGRILEQYSLKKSLFWPFLAFFTLGGILYFSENRAWVAGNCPDDGQHSDVLPGCSGF